MITNAVPVTILLAYIPIPRHIRNSVLIRRIIASHLCTVVGGQRFCKESKKLQTRIIFERSDSFFYYCLLSCRHVMFQKSILSKLKWGAQAVVRGGTAPSCPPIAMALSITTALTILPLKNLR